MITHNRSEMKQQDQLDGMIRWTLRDGLVGVSAPPSAWSEIVKRVGGRAERSQAGRWRELRFGLRWVAQSVLELTAGPTNPLVYAGGAEYGNMRQKYDLVMLRYQPQLVMLLGHVL